MRRWLPSYYPFFLYVYSIWWWPHFIFILHSLFLSKGPRIWNFDKTLQHQKRIWETKLFLSTTFYFEMNGNWNKDWLQKNYPGTQKPIKIFMKQDLEVYFFWKKEPFCSKKWRSKKISAFKTKWDFYVNFLSGGATFGEFLVWRFKKFDCCLKVA